MEMNSDNSYLCSCAIIFVGRFLCVVRHLEDMLQCPRWSLDTYSAVSPWLQFSNKMAGEPVVEGKQVLFATEAELYIEQLKPYPLKEVGSSKWVSLVVWWCHFMFFSHRWARMLWFFFVTPLSTVWRAREAGSLNNRKKTVSISQMDESAWIHRKTKHAGI